MTGAYQEQTSQQVRLVQVTQETAGTPGSLPSGVCMYKCMPVSVSSFGNTEGGSAQFSASTDPDRAIYVLNFRNNVPILGEMYLAFMLDNGVYVFDNQAAFLENM